MTWSPQTIQLIDFALDEDLGERGDVTAALLPDRDRFFSAAIAARREGVVCGLALAGVVVDAFNRRFGFSGSHAVRLTPLHRRDLPSREWADGDRVSSGDAVALVDGPRHAVLSVERTLLNFLGRMSGVATLTQAFVAAAREKNAAVDVLDTRKTIPGWRELDKYSVRAGGGRNHRSGLHDAVLIKDNHIAGVPVGQLATHLAKLLSQLVDRAALQFVEVEVDSLDQFRAIAGVGGVDIVLLDNFAIDDLRAAVAERDRLGLRGRLALEASGNVTLKTIGDIAATGVDRISAGAITHSAPNFDWGLDAR